MRLTVLTLTLLSATTFSGLAFADDAPERSPELQVLDHIAGTWKVVITVRAGDQESTETVYVTREWSSDGQFLLEQDRASTTRGAWTYDPEAKSYRFVVLGRNWGVLCNCEWNEKTRTLTVRGVDHDSNVITSPIRIINQDYFESSTVVKNADGDVIVEMTHKQTRIKADAKAEVDRPADLAKDDPLESLNRRVGTWVNKNYHKKAEWTLEAGTTTGEETIKWVLDKNFIQGDTNYPDGTKGRNLINYDRDAKVYRSWYFDNRNAFPRGESIGRWNAEKERMDWEMDFGNGITGKMVFQYTGKDKMEWSLEAHDPNGKLMLDVGGTQTRKGTADAASSADNPNAEVERIIAKHLKAIGGLQAHKKHKTRRLTGTFTMGGQAINVTAIQKAPNFSHVTVNVPGVGAVKEVNTPDGSWRITQQSTSAITGRELIQKQREAIFHRWVDLKSQYQTIRNGGRETVNGKEYLVLIGVYANDDTESLYFDPETYLIRLTKADSVTVELGDYRTVDSVRMPMSVAIPTMQINWSVTEVAHGVKVDDSLFAKPTDTTNKTIGEMDASGDGRITRDEASEDLKLFFDDYDVNKDGAIDSKEARALEKTAN